LPHTGFPSEALLGIGLVLFGAGLLLVGGGRLWSPS
jgi:LPXTG-motif cell wall-anchored protein